VTRLLNPAGVDWVWRFMTTSTPVKSIASDFELPDHRPRTGDEVTFKCKDKSGYTLKVLKGKPKNL
jgi:hypothetical protein